MKVEITIKDNKKGSCEVKVSKKEPKKFTENERITQIAIYNAVCKALKELN